MSNHNYTAHLVNKTGYAHAYYRVVRKNKLFCVVFPAFCGVSTHSISHVSGKREARKIAAEKGYEFIN